MFELIYILIILLLMPFVVRRENWGCLGFFLYFGMCLAFTPIVGIFIFKKIFHG